MPYRVVTTFTLSIQAPASLWDATYSTWTSLNGLAESLVAVPLDADGVDLDAPMPIMGPTWDLTSSCNFDATFTAGTDWAGDCCGVRVSHTNPGFASPIWWAILGVAIDGGTTQDTYGDTPLHVSPPVYDDIPAGTWRTLAIAQGYYTEMALAATGIVYGLASTLDHYELSGEALPVDAGWLASIAATTRPDVWTPGTMLGSVPLGDVTIMFASLLAPPRYLRQRQGPRGNAPRVSWGRL